MTVMMIFLANSVLWKFHINNMMCSDSKQNKTTREVSIPQLRKLKLRDDTQG